MVAQFLYDQAIEDSNALNQSPSFNFSNFSNLSGANQGIAATSIGVPENWRDKMNQLNNWGDSGARYEYNRPYEMSDVAGQVGEYNPQPGQGYNENMYTQKKGFNFPKINMGGLAEIFKKLPTPMNLMRSMARNPLDPNSPNYNPKLQEQMNFIKDKGVYDQNKITGGVLQGKNLVSGFGTNDLQQMYADQLGKYQKTYENLDEQWGDTLNDKEMELKKQAYFNKFIKPGLDQQEELTNYMNQQTQKNIQKEKDVVTQLGVNAGDVASSSKAFDHMKGSGGGWSPAAGQMASGMGGGSQQAKSGSQKAGGSGRTDKGWGWAQGGRVGYQGGELVEQETDFIQGPQGGEEFQETVVEGQEQPSREQLEALSMEIFQLPLDDLDEQQLLVVYQEAMQGQPMEEAVQEDEVQYVAQGGLAGLL